MTFHIGDEVRQGRRIGTVTPLSILKRIVMFSFGMSSVCHFGHESEIVSLQDSGRCAPPESAARRNWVYMARISAALPFTLSFSIVELRSCSMRAAILAPSASSSSSLISTEAGTGIMSRSSSSA